MRLYTVHIVSSGDLHRAINPGQWTNLNFFHIQFKIALIELHLNKGK